MSADSIVDRLIEASERGLMLAQAPDYRRASFSEREADAAVGQLGARPDARGYHLLMALRRADRGAYERVPAATRAAILCDVLRTQPNLNDFGHLGPGGAHDGPAAKALLELGEAAVPCLREILDDDRPAPLMGSEEATLSQLHSYRRSDFAYRYLTKIRGGEPGFEPTPGERDPALADLRARLAAA